MTSLGPEDLSRWLWRDALPLWARVGVDPAGGFHEGIDRQGRPWPADRRLRVQARQTWVFANAFRLMGSDLWRAAMIHGMAELTGRRLRPDGLYQGVLDSGGRAVGGEPLLYDQAFVLLAFSAVHQADPSLVDAPSLAAALMRRIAERFRHDTGGYVEADPSTPYYANPHMHLFEALLAWEALEPAGNWEAEAAAIAELALRRFIDPVSGAIREHFDAHWDPAPGEPSRAVEPGHQFEWSWLLRRWGVARGRSDAVATADRLFRIGCDHGVDRARGVAYNSMRDDFTPSDRAARLWPQTEWLKAATTGARQATDPETKSAYAAQIEPAADALRLYLDVEVPGSWRDLMSLTGEFEDAFAPASSLYHIAGAVWSLAPG